MPEYSSLRCKFEEIFRFLVDLKYAYLLNASRNKFFDIEDTIGQS